MSFFLALGNVASNVFTEVTSTGYARQAIGFTAPTKGVVQGVGSSFTYSAVAANAVGTYNAFGVFTANTAGTPIVMYNLPQTYTFGNTTNFVVNPYSISFDILDSQTRDALPIDLSMASALTGINQVAYRNLTATTDPTVSNDATQGFDVGSVWINTSSSRVWMCQNANSGAAVWLLDGVVPGVGVEPSGMLTQFGNSVASFPEEGNVNRQVLSTGVSPAATGADYIIASYALPANAFDVAGRGITVTACGSFGADGNNKTVKLIWNANTAVVGAQATGNVICSTGVVTTNNAGWQVQGSIFKVGNTGSNTQLCIHDQAQCGSVVSAMLVPTIANAIENAVINIVVTGNAATTNTDIVIYFTEINAMN